jgi:hypothetical protein
MHCIWIVTYVLLSAPVVLSQWYGTSDSLQNYTRGTPQSPSTAANTTQSLPSPNWMVKYDSGSLGFKPDQWLRIAFVPQAALGEIKALVFSIPADRLVTVEYSSKTKKISHLMQGPRSGCSYARSFMPETAKNPRPEVAVAVAISPGPVSRLAEKLSAKHPVRFVWNEEGGPKSLVVKVTDCEYQSFIANVQWLVGSRWSEVGRDSGRWNPR